MTTLQTSIKHLSVGLKILSSFIDRFSWWVSIENYRAYTELLACYQQTVELYQSTATNNIKSADLASANLQVLRCHQAVNQVVQTAIASLAVEQLSSSLNELLVAYNQLSVMTNLPQIEQQKKITEEKLAQIENQWQGYKEGILQRLSFYQLKKRGFSRALPASATNFLNAKRLQHALVFCRQALASEDYLLGDHQSVQQAQEKDWLKLNDYAEVVVLSQILRSGIIEENLNRMLVIYQEYLAQLQIQANQLKIRYGQSLRECVRLQRALLIYQKWEATLLQLKQKLLQLSSQPSQPEGMNDWISELLRQFTYGKKAFLKIQFKNLPAYAVFKKLNEQAKNQDAIILLAQLRQQKKALKNNIYTLQQQLLENGTYLQKAKAHVSLAITQQPDYQLGFFASQYIHDQYHQRGLFQEPLPSSILQRLNGITGLTFLGLTFYFSGWFGYSYHLFSAVNRVLLAQVDNWINCSEYIDQLTQKAGLPLLRFLAAYSPKQFQSLIAKSESLLRWDEQGLMEKEEIIQWLLGLGLQMLLAGELGLPTLLGYTTATTVNQLSDQLCLRILEPWDPSPETLAIAQTLVRMQTYAIAYRQGYELGLSMRQYGQDAVLQQEALTKFGFHSVRDLNSRILRERYRKLSLQFHPDKCSAEEKTICQDQMQQLNSAYELLQKKLD